MPLNLDINKCQGCRKGISLIEKDIYRYVHIDIFWQDHECQNSDEIARFIMPSQERLGFYSPNKEIAHIFERREKWCDDIFALCNFVFESMSEIEEFVSRWTEMSDYEIECEIIRMAIDLSVEVDEKRYPDLFFWKQVRP